MSTATPPARRILALDASGRTARVGVVTGDQRLVAQRSHTALRHADVLLRMCHEVFQETGLSPAQIDGYACTQGPGTFTGLRAGLSVCKGLALPFNKPLWAISALQALASDLDVAVRKSPEETVLCVACIDAGKGELHTQAFRNGAVAAPPTRLTPQDFAARLAAWANQTERLALGGSGWDRHEKALRALNLPEHLQVVEPAPGPSPLAIAALATQRLNASTEGARGDNLNALLPTYGRPPDITKPKPRST